jgi:hypothetical protein
MAVNKIKLAKAKAALVKAGMSPAMATSAAKLLDLDAPLVPQIMALGEEDPELFNLDDDEDDTEDEDETPMTAQEAKVARMRGSHRLSPTRGEGETSAQRLASALTEGRTSPARQSTAPTPAQKAAERLTRGIGSAADRSSYH